MLNTEDLLKCGSIEAKHHATSMGTEILKEKNGCACEMLFAGKIRLNRCNMYTGFPFYSINQSLL